MNKEIEAKHYVRKKSAVSAKIDEEVVILDIESGVYYSLNDTGNEIWEILSEPVSVPEILSRLSEVYDMPKDEGLDSIMTLLAGLETSGLIEKVIKK